MLSRFASYLSSHIKTEMVGGRVHVLSRPARDSNLEANRIKQPYWRDLDAVQRQRINHIMARIPGPRSAGWRTHCFGLRRIARVLL